MKINTITVYSGAIDLQDVISDLLKTGIVVLETMRTQARMIANEASEMLEIDLDGENDSNLIHLSAEVGFEGWSDFLLYTAIADYVPGETQKLVKQAVTSWLNADCPDIHVSKVQN